MPSSAPTAASMASPPTNSPGTPPISYPLSPTGYFSVTADFDDLFLNYTPTPEPTTALLVLPPAVYYLSRRRHQKTRILTNCFARTQAAFPL